METNPVRPPSSMPEAESLENFAATGATLAIHLSVHVLAEVQARLIPRYGVDCPVAVVFRASWPDQRVIRATLGSIDPAIGALKKNKKADEQEDDDEKQYECTKACPAKALH